MPQRKGGEPGSTESYSLVCHIDSRLIQAALQWLIGDALLGDGGKYCASLGEGQPEAFSKQRCTHDGGQARQEMVTVGAGCGRAARPHRWRG